MPQKLRNYQLYSNRVQFFTHYDHQPFLLDVRAVSLRQAIFLAANRRLSPDGTAAGIVFVDHNDGPRYAKQFFYNDVPAHYYDASAEVR